MMKKLYVLLVIVSMGSCSEEPDVSPDWIFGKWQLIESLISPGSIGKFKKVDSDNTIEFFEDSTFATNSPFCFTNTNHDQYTGTFDIEKMVILPTDCQTYNDSSMVELHYDFDSYNLIIYFSGCVEPCAGKYKKMD